MGKLKANGPGCIGQVMGGRKVLDETCRCGHSTKRHAPIVGLPADLSEGKGKCCVGGCECTRFGWDRFVFEDKPGS